MNNQRTTSPNPSPVVSFPDPILGLGTRLIHISSLYLHTYSILQFVGGPGASACIVEESVVDSAAKTFTMYSRNINFAKLMSVEEKCVYYVSPENENW